MIVHLEVAVQVRIHMKGGKLLNLVPIPLGDERGLLGLVGVGHEGVVVEGVGLRDIFVEVSLAGTATLYQSQ